jgi:hypothetical protein
VGEGNRTLTTSLEGEGCGLAEVFEDAPELAALPRIEEVEFETALNLVGLSPSRMPQAPPPAARLVLAGSPSLLADQRLFEGRERKRRRPAGRPPAQGIGLEPVPNGGFRNFHRRP